MSLNLQKLYCDEQYQYQALSASVVFSAKLWFESPIVAQLPKLLSLWSSLQSKEITPFEFGKQTVHYPFNWLADTIRLITVFENLFKVDLIARGLLIHEIKSSLPPHVVDQGLRKVQYKRPIRVEECLKCFDQVNTPGSLTSSSHYRLDEPYAV